MSWVGLFHPAYKLSPDLIRDGTHLYTVRVERGRACTEMIMTRYLRISLLVTLTAARVSSSIQRGVS